MVRTACATHFAIVAGFSESGVPPRLADHDGGRPTTQWCGVHGSDARSQSECQDTGLRESGDDHKLRLALFGLECESPSVCHGYPQPHYFNRNTASAATPPTARNDPRIACREGAW